MNITGATAYAVRKIFEVYFPEPFTDPEITDSRVINNSMVYTVIIDDYLKSEAELRAKLECVPAFYNFRDTTIEDIKIINARPLRNTYKIQIKVS